MAEKKYTVVQHSAAGYNGDPTFSRGLEPRALSTAAEVKRVEKAGGIVFPDYVDADNAADRFMYPDKTTDMIPNVAGTFSDVTVDGLKVYVPVRQVTIVG